jgi:hypothetical protein
LDRSVKWRWRHNITLHGAGATRDAQKARASIDIEITGIGTLSNPVVRECQ